MRASARRGQRADGVRRAGPSAVGRRARASTCADARELACGVAADARRPTAARLRDCGAGRARRCRRPRPRRPRRRRSASGSVNVPAPAYRSRTRSDPSGVKRVEHESDERLGGLGVDLEEASAPRRSSSLPRRRSLPVRPCPTSTSTPAILRSFAGPFVEHADETRALERLAEGRGRRACGETGRERPTVRSRRPWCGTPTRSRHPRQPEVLLAGDVAQSAAERLGCLARTWEAEAARFDRDDLVGCRLVEAQNASQLDAVVDHELDLVAVAVLAGDGNGLGDELLGIWRSAPMRVSASTTARRLAAS